MSAGDRTAHPPKVMGFRDLVLFYVVTGVSLRWIATAAAAGPSSLIVWLGAFLCFYIPLAYCVIELSSRYPEEGGLYVWTREAFGPFAGYMAGWSYFASQLPYFPSIFYFDAGNAIYIGGGAWTHLETSAAYFMAFSLVAIGFVTIINIVGLKTASLMHNIGAIGMWLPALIVVVMGAVAWSRYGSATDFTPRAMVPSTQFKDMIFWASLCFALSGCEAASFMSGEIKDARRTIPRALMTAGAVVVFCYVVGTVCVLLALRPEEVNSLQGLIQAGARTAGKLGWAWIVPPLALLITLGNLGAASAFLAASARIPFVVGLDRMLPAVVGEVHPRWGTPWVAILLQGGFGAVFVVLGQAGTSVKGAYDVLVSMGIIAAFIPFALIFLAMIRFRSREPAGGTKRVLSIVLAAIGLVTTLAGIAFATTPSPDDPNKLLAVLKIVGLSAILLGIGATLYALGRRRALSAATA